MKCLHAFIKFVKLATALHGCFLFPPSVFSLSYNVTPDELIVCSSYAETDREGEKWMSTVSSRGQ